MFIANIRYSRIDAISLDKQYHTIVYSNHENETGIIQPLALDLDTTNGYETCSPSLSWLHIDPIGF